RGVEGISAGDGGLRFSFVTFHFLFMLKVFQFAL
ncbi:MAG: hypothetical protein ACI82E_000759, partial [Nonlabens sp.]